MDDKHLNKDNEIYRQLFNVSEKATLLHDLSGKIIDANPAAQKLLGFEFAAEKTFEISNFLISHDKTNPIHDKYLGAVNSKGYLSQRLPIITGGDETTQCRIFSRKLNLPGDALFMLTIQPDTDQDIVSWLSGEADNINREIMESAHDAILIMDDEKFILCNQSALNIFGCTDYNELVYHSPWEFSPKKQPDGSDSMLKAKLLLNEVLAGNPKRFSWLHNTKDGSLFGAEVSLNALKFKGKKYIQAILRDNSIFNQIEENARETESRFKSLLNNMDTGVAFHEIIVDERGEPVDFIFLAANPVYEKITKLKAADIIGKKGKAMLPDLEQKWIDLYGKVALTGESISTVDHSTYLKKWWDVKAFSPKKGQFAVMLTDITEQKINRITLENTKITMQQAEEIGQLGFYEQNWHTGQGSWSKGLLKLLGYPEIQKGFTYEKFLEHIYQDDKDNAIAQATKSREQGTLIDTEFRIVRKDGNVIWVQSIGHIEHDEQGRPAKTTGLLRDITETRRMKAVMDKFFEQPFNIHLVVDLEGKVMQINNGCETITGYTKEAFIGNSVFKFIHPDDIPSTKAELLKLTQGEKTYYFKNRYKHKNGNFRWLAWSAVASTENNLIYAVANDITEYENARKELEKQNISHATLLSNLKGMVYRCKNDRNWTIEYASDGCTELTGYKPEVFYKKIIGYNDIILPKYREIIWDTWQKNIKEKKPVETEYEILTESGQTKWVWEKGCGIYDKDGNLMHIEGIISDITERKKAESRAEKLSKAVEQSPESIIITDKSGNIEYVNPQFTKLTGYTLGEAIGNTPSILLSGEHDQKYYQNLWSTIINGNEWHGEFKNQKKNGELYWERASISPILNQDGEITHFVAVKEDITTDKKILAELKQAKEKAEESDRLKTAFLANMSHEIRTPMNGILGFAELLQENDLSNDEKHKYANVILKSGERMLNIINDLIDISKLESGQMEMVVSHTNINEQMKFLYTFFKPEAETRGLKFSYNTGLPDEDAVITTDKEKLYAILTNLLKNAIKFTNKGSIDFGYTRTTDSGLQKPVLQFYVKDTGIGIASNRQEAIFERFVQADIKIAKPYEGAGLGLTITKAYTQMLGGKINVESAEGKGSTFRFTIPCQEHEKPAQKSSASQKPEADKLFSNLRVLIVEDDETADLFLSEILEENCKALLHTRSGSEAIEICKANPDIDLILMDIKLPGLDGYATTREIRKFNREIIIIAQTAYALTGDRKKAIDAGCNDYLAKPVKKDELIDLIKKYF